MINFNQSNILPSDIKLAEKSIKSGWLTHGKYTKLFEEEFKRFTGSKYAVTVSSCTAGLHLSCLACNFKKGDEVLVPSITHTATAHAVEYSGAKPIFVNIDKISGNISFESIKELTTSKTKGLVLVHMSGKACELNKITAHCKRNKIKIIEDCAHSLGSFYKGKHVGNFGTSGCFSFYPTKQITTGEGGMVITNNKYFYKKIIKLKAFGINSDIKHRKVPGKYDVNFLGFNYRLTDFQSALGYSQIKRYKKDLKIRKAIAKRYIKNLKNFNKISMNSFSNDDSYFIFSILVFNKNRDRIVNKLKALGIGTSIHYARALFNYSFYKKKYLNDFKNKYFKHIESNNFANFNISLPVYSKLSLKDVDTICKKLISVINE
jgi:perosamine synthetase